MDYQIRVIRESEYPILKDFLYEAIFVPEGVLPPPREILNRPELQVYIAGFGEEKGDMGLLAEVNHKIVGAVWARIMDDYGHIDEETPSFAGCTKGLGLKLSMKTKKNILWCAGFVNEIPGEFGSICFLDSWVKKQ